MDDLQDLLNQLDPIGDKKDIVWIDEKLDLNDIIDFFDDDSDSIISLTPDILSTSNNIPNITNISDIGIDSSMAIADFIDSPPPVGIEVSKYMARLDGVTEEILSACRSDRQEAQDVIKMLRDQINDSLNNKMTPSRMFVDGLVKAVEVKANINMTAVKIMEANAKMLAATKSNNVLVNQNLNLGNNSDLEKILSEPITSADEY